MILEGGGYIALLLIHDIGTRQQNSSSNIQQADVVGSGQGLT